MRLRELKIRGKKLVIFDIDDTLLHTTAKINVVKDGKVVKNLTNQEYNTYELQPGEEYDFGEFRDAQKFEDESVPIGPMLDKLRDDLAAGHDVVMLTARADFDNQRAVWRTFLRHGIDINKDVHLYRAGNLPGRDNPAFKKAVHVKNWLSSGKYRDVTMYDDSEKNLTVFKSLKKNFPSVDFEAHHVSPEGTTKQVEQQIQEKKRKRKKVRAAAWGPGPYGWYGYNAGYSGEVGDGGGGGDGGGMEEGSGLDQEAGIGIDGKSFKFKVKDLITFAKKYPVTKIDPSQFRDQIAGRDEDPTQSAARAEKADLQFPIIVVKRQNGKLWIADGTHRAQKAIDDNLLIQAKIIPIKDMSPFIEKKSMVEGLKTIIEYRDRLFQYVKYTMNNGFFKEWPDYVLKDWIVPNKGDFSGYTQEQFKNDIMKKVQLAGLSSDTKWQLVPNMKFTKDMWEPMTEKELIDRAGGHSDSKMGIHKDKERHATQAALIQQQGGVRKEPVILIKTVKGYKLLEGWHRTIQHFAMFPDGYTGPAWVAAAQGQQGVTESINATKENFVEIFSKFLPLAVKILKLKSLPKFEFKDHLEHSDQPTFGIYKNEEKTLYVALADRHPNDILRTVAHELAHYKQDTEHMLGDDSGRTGSPEENQANAAAGIIMRYFNKLYPEYIRSQPLTDV